MSTMEAPVLPLSDSDRTSTRQPRQRRPRGDRASNVPNTQDVDHPQVFNGARRGGGAGGGGRGRTARDGLLSLRPASVAPRSQTQSIEPSSAEVSGAEQPNAPPRQSRRGRGGKMTQTHTVNGRAFGGQLTQDASAGQLQADAPTFVPGQQNGGRRNAQHQQQQQQMPKRRMSKSTAPDIATRTHHDIDNGHYECAICTNEVLRNSKVWSCKTCWTVFHLSCVKKWATNEGSAASQQQNGDIPPPRQWRCPGCNLPKDVLPKSYTCWCGKEVEPRPVTGIPPHSCGNTCAKERVRKCPHPCQLTCHAGPCPPCKHMGTTQSCFCGKHESTRRCVDTDYESGWSCGEICGDIMPCGEHECPRPCHEGLCGACEVRIEARCYCGQTEKDILCSDRGEDQRSHRKHINEDGSSGFEEDWIGMFQCAKSCNRPFDCNEHQCQKNCHPQSGDAPHCPFSPDMVSHCPCGKTPLSDITDVPRQSCKDVIPKCDKPCMKQLPCGHACERSCHSGNCSSCTKTVMISCRCGRTTSRSICHQGVEEAPQCARVCRVTLNCGRHACDERCCPGEKKAAERQAMKRKQRPLNSASRPIDDGFEAEHICTRACGRPLKCGNHVCMELCHKGPCGSCREAIFDELSCHCGRTVLQPPLPCGTRPPPCRYQCNRPKLCGHPQVQHNCHLNDESCPKCPFLVEKRCMCGKKNLKNQQCWLQDVRCGEICGRKLKCGSHFCRKQCHRPGECEDAGGQPCQQACGKPKKVCEHPDENICHAPYPCKEDKPCPHKIFITCECQAQKQEMRCNASKDSEGNLQKSLPCNDECARLERNRKLAVALNIDQSTHVDGGDHIPFSTETLTLFASHPKWGQNQEREFRVFAAAEDEKRFRFKPMSSQQRAFLHHLAEDFGLDSESMDPEPHRHVVIFKTPRFVAAPNKTLAECLRIRAAQHIAAGKGGNTSDGEGAKKVRASNEVGEPFNGFVISQPRFALTVEEVRAEVLPVVGPAFPAQFDIEFLPSEEVVLKAMSRTIPPDALDQILKDIKMPLAKAIAAKGLGILQLCHADSSLNVLRRESDSVTSDGWSRVAAKGAAPRRVNPQSGVAGTNAFSALSGNKVTFAVKKKEKKPVKVVEPVVDDWEAAEIAEEEKEKGASGAEDDAASMVASAASASEVHEGPADIEAVEAVEAGEAAEASTDGGVAVAVVAAESQPVVQEEHEVHAEAELPS